MIGDDMQDHVKINVLKDETGVKIEVVYDFIDRDGSPLTGLVLCCFLKCLYGDLTYTQLNLERLSEQYTPAWIERIKRIIASDPASFKPWMYSTDTRISLMLQLEIQKFAKDLFGESFAKPRPVTDSNECS